MMIVSKRLPKKKEGSGRAQWMIQSSRSNRLQKISNEKVVQKKEEYEAAINDTVESCRSGKKGVKLLAGKIQAKRTPT